MPPDNYLLTLMIFAPTAGALAILLLKGIEPILKARGRPLPGTLWRWIALFATGVPLILATLLGHRNWLPAWVINLAPDWLANTPGFDPSGGPQFEHHFVWIREFSIEYFVGVDGISVSMVILTALISFIACLASWRISKKPAGYFTLFLLLETGMMGTFCALDMFLFYVFWEVMLLPMYFLIGIWGGPRKEYAAIKFFLYTLAGSVLMLLAVIALYYASRPMVGIELALVDGTPVPHTFNLLRLADLGQAGMFAGADPIMGIAFTKIIWVGLFIGFAIKVPMFPFHTWLPDAHVEAPTPVSVILAGILLKMGTYGMLRFNWAILPDATKWAAYAVAVFGAINIVYAAFVCMAQKDLKKLIAYSSVSHMGFCLLGMAACTPQAISGAVFQMWGHGIVSPMLFLIAGVIYDRAHTRDIEGFGGLASFMPEYSGLTGLAFFASLGLPGLIGFVGEVLVFLGAWGTPASMGTGYRTLVAISALSVIITAAYYLWTMQRMFLGRFNDKWKDLVPDLTVTERLTLYPLGAMAIFFGLFPLPVFDLINPAIHFLAETVRNTPSA
jgi:NADH-quinone oxidoreductase subunit M